MSAVKNRHRTHLNPTIEHSFDFQLKCNLRVYIGKHLSYIPTFPHFLLDTSPLISLSHCYNHYSTKCNPFTADVESRRRMDHFTFDCTLSSPHSSQEFSVWHIQSWLKAVARRPMVKKEDHTDDRGGQRPLQQANYTELKKEKNERNEKSFKTISY